MIATLNGIVVTPNDPLFAIIEDDKLWVRLSPMLEYVLVRARYSMYIWISSHRVRRQDFNLIREALIDDIRREAQERTPRTEEDVGSSVRAI